MNDICKPYGFIYITSNTVNGKKYIGKRVFDSRGKWKSYLGSGVLLRKAIEKYGKENFSRKIIDYAYSQEELNEKERYWIEYYGAIGSSVFYNIASGGDGGCLLSGYSEKEVAAIRVKHKYSIQKAAEQGKMCTNNKLTKSDVVMISHRIHNNECLADIARDYGVSEMTISDIKNKRTWRYVVGQEDFSDYRVTYKETKSKPVVQFDAGMNYIATYKNARDAERMTGIGYKMISKVCHGKRPHTHGFVFQFVSDPSVAEKSVV